MNIIAFFSVFFKVVFNEADRTVDCTCMHFTRHGYLCRHAFSVFRSNDVNEIPSVYVLRRWRRDALPVDMIQLRTKYRDGNHVDKEAYGVYSDINYCVRLLSNNKEKFTVFREKISQLRTELEVELTDQPILSKEAIMTSVIGVSRPEKIDVEVPSGINNKGCRIKKRKVGAREQAAKKSKKKKRHCKKCDKLVRHDSRNHDKVMAAKAAAKEAKKAKSGNQAEESIGMDSEFSTSEDETNEPVAKKGKRVGKNVDYREDTDSSSGEEDEFVSDDETYEETDENNPE